jgi:hypothetical protein
MAINFPDNPVLDELYTYSGKTWKWNGSAWEKSSATETGNAEGNTGEVAYYYGKGSNIQGATGLYYDDTNLRVGIGTDTPQLPLEVVGSVGITGGTGNYISFPDGSTQGVASIQYFSTEGETVYSNTTEEEIFSGIDISTDNSLTVLLQKKLLLDVPNTSASFGLGLSNNIPRLDETNTFTATNGNVFETPIGSNRYAGNNAVEVFIASIDHGSSTYMGITSGTINYKILGTDILDMDTDIHAYVGISADAGATFGGDVNFLDNEVTKSKLKDYAETVNAVGNITGNTNFDFENGNVQTLTIVSGTPTLGFINPPSTGIAGSMTLIITNGGASAVTWNAAVKWPGGNAPALTSSGVDVLSFLTTDAGTTIYGFVGGINFS